MGYETKIKTHVFLRRYLLLLISLIASSLFIFACFRFVDLRSDKPFRVLVDDTITDFLVNTPGCQIPSWDPWHPSVKLFYEPIPEYYKCPGIPSFLQVKPNAIVSLDTTILNYYYEVNPEYVLCTYQVISRSDKNTTNVDNEYIISPPVKLNFDVPLKEDFIKTFCRFKGVIRTADSAFVEYIPLTPLKYDLKFAQNQVQETSQSSSQELLNVIFLGLDSISRLNFIRHFQKTNDYISKNLMPVKLKGYTKVGDNTFPNLVPLLTGHFHEYYGNITRNGESFFDDVDFLWKAFSKKGYKTFLAEDAPQIATFNYFRKGFKDPPTDYYYRPFALALEDSIVRSNSRPHCFGNKMEMVVVFEYLKSFINTIGGSRLYFAFLFLARLTHDDFNYAGYADEPTYELLRYLHDFHLLNNTALVFFSDHGIRFGPIRQTYIGQFEERMPFMNLILPRWFLKKHKKLYQNLKTNENRLTTPFDIHETVLSLLNLKEPAEEPILESPSINLFNEVSPYRTCEAASISPHWCPCHIQKSLSVKDKMVNLAAVTVIKQINQWTRPLRRNCSALSLQEIHDARKSTPIKDLHHKNNNSSSSTDVSDYLIVISASPSKGLFESTVRCQMKRRTCYIVDDISRINRYGEQSSCINDAYLKKFCFCG